MASTINVTVVLLLYCCTVTSIDGDFYASDREGRKLRRQEDTEDITDHMETMSNISQIELLPKSTPSLATTDPVTSTAQLKLTEHTFADLYDDIEDSSRPDQYGTHINRGFDPPFAMSQHTGMKSQEAGMSDVFPKTRDNSTVELLDFLKDITQKENFSSPLNDNGNEEALSSSAQSYFPPVMQVQEYALDETAYKSTTSLPDVARRLDSPLLSIDNFYKITAEEDKKRKDLLEQGYEKYQHINFKRGRNIVPVDLFFDVNLKTRPEQFEPKSNLYVPFAAARSYKTLRGNNVKLLRLFDETAPDKSGSGELPQKILGEPILMDEVPDQHFQDDVKVVNDIEPDLQPNPAETYPREIPRVYDEVQRASWLQTPSSNSVDSLIEPEQEEEKVYDRKSPKTPVPVYETSTVPVNIKSRESMQPLSSVLNLTANSTATNTFAVRPEIATPLLSAISDLAHDDYDWEDKEEWRPRKSPAMKKKSSGVLGWRSISRQHKKMGMQQHRERFRGDALDRNGKRFVLANQMHHKKEKMLPNQKFRLLQKKRQRMNYRNRSKQMRQLRRQKVNSGSKTVQLDLMKKVSSNFHKQHSVKRTLEYGGQRTRNGLSTKIRLWNREESIKPRKKVRRSCKC